MFWDDPNRNVLRGIIRTVKGNGDLRLEGPEGVQSYVTKTTDVSRTKGNKL